MTTPAAACDLSDELFATTDMWDLVVEELECQGGMTLVKLPPNVAKVHAHAFQVARCCLENDACHHGNVSVTIPPDADSAHVTGYHPPQGMSHYNAFREGFVFSDGNLIGDNNFKEAMQDMFASLHGIAQHVLSALERKWELPFNWFQKSLGPTHCHSQWHIKRYVLETRADDDDFILLPLHTDPSLISIVVHDREGTTHQKGVGGGAMGLQYQLEGQWMDVPTSGHDVATIFVGSLLSYITGNTIKAAKHRVVNQKSGSSSSSSRMAATLFVRPRGTALLQVPPSLHFQNVTMKKIKDFQAWNNRVSRNYMKQKPPQHDAARRDES